VAQAVRASAERARAEMIGMVRDRGVRRKRGLLSAL
jgi:hypothetical protein